MFHFVSIYYNAQKVQSARADLDYAPGRTNPSLRPLLLERLEQTYRYYEFDTNDGFRAALTQAFKEQTVDSNGLIFLTVTGHGPFAFGTNRMRITDYARGVGAGTDIYETLRPAIENTPGADVSRFRVITDAVSVAGAGYWARYTGQEETRSYTVASFILGTGVGAAIVQKYGRVIGRAHHSEFGHTRIHILEDDPAPVSVCDYHGGCLQGMVSWAALEAKAKGMNSSLKAAVDNDDHPMWPLVAKYIAQGCQNLMFTAPPSEIVMCGSLFDLGPSKLEKIIHQAIKDEMGQEFLYLDAQRDNFLVKRSLAQEALVGNIHHGISLLQKAPSFNLFPVE
ncbi:MAG: ROK family protein [Pseudomonadota bacterium]